MDKKNAPRRICRVATYVPMDDYDKLFKEYQSTTCRNLSEFIRDKLTCQPQTILHRNQSADEFLPVAISLKNQLTAAVKELRLVIAGLRSSQELSDPGRAIDQLEPRIFFLEQVTEEIKTRMNQIYEQWFIK